MTLTAEPGLFWGQVQNSCPGAGRFPNAGWLRASCGSLPIMAVGLGNGERKGGAKSQRFLEWGRTECLHSQEGVTH